MSLLSGSRNGYQQLRPPEQNFSQILNKGTDDQLVCYGYKKTVWCSLLYYVLCVVTLGGFWLVLYWRPDWKIKFTKMPCLLAYADEVLLKDHFNQQLTAEVQILLLEEGLGDFRDRSISLVKSENLSDEDTKILTPKQRPHTRFFVHQYLRYFWSHEERAFKLLVGLDKGTKCSEFHSEFHGYSELEQRQKLKIFGCNEIVVEVKSYFKLLVEEVLNPFYIFQLFSVILWMCDDYYYYAGCIILISVISIVVSLYETKKQSITLRDMVASHEVNVMTVSRGDGVFEELPTSKLVPGDVVVIPQHGCMMSCDAVLLVGNCIVNESMLTGESVPVTKTPLPNQSDSDEVFSPDDVHKRYTLFCGTQVIQTRYYGAGKVTAVVVRTGYSTTKGELVRAILFPKPMDFKFYQDAIRFVQVLFLIASIGMIYNIATFLSRGESAQRIILRTLDIVTICVPPALPAAMTVGTIYAQNRLKKAGIFCISPPRINMCGKLKCICFDKTGTLTEDGLDLFGVVPLQENRFLHVVQHPTDLPIGPFLTAMATCHSLTMIEGELKGDPLDLKMFESTNWILQEPGRETTRFDNLIPTTVHPPSLDTLFTSSTGFDGFEQLLEEPGQDTSKFDIMVPTIVKPITKESYYSGDTDKIAFEVGIVRQFVFTSALQRMSVITRTLGNTQMDLYCKGAPEKVASLCKQDTLPEDYSDVLHRFTMKGFRVIALAWRQLDPKLNWHHAMRVQRETVECELTFLGLIIMQNSLKPETTPVIRQLKAANIRVVMATGDNMHTAISVARDCAMVDEEEKVIMVKASPPSKNSEAVIHWEYAEVNLDNELTVSTAEESDASYHALNIVRADAYHFALDGRSFGVVRQYFPELLPKICVKGTIFARMSPDQKGQLIEQLQDLGYVVGMCGDGANDCGALKTAHAGISLSEAEASVASPFTSKTPNIECVPTVIREGRAALVTSFGVFKYMALYSMIQFVTVMILYTLDTNLSDMMFLYIDLVITTTVAVLMGHTSAYHKLVPRPPKGSLVSVSNLFSILSQTVGVVTFQLGAFFYLTSQSWYPAEKLHPIINDDEHNVVCPETTTLFISGSFQYLILSVIFSKGPPYRKRIWTNVLFLVSVILLTALTAWLWLYPPTVIREFLMMKLIPDEYIVFKITVVLLAVMHFVIAESIESFIIDRNIPSSCLKKCFGQLSKPKKKYKIIEKELSDNPHWPPVGDVTREAEQNVQETSDVHVSLQVQ